MHVASHTAHISDQILRRFGKHAYQGLEAETRIIAKTGRALSAADYLWAKHEFHNIQAEMSHFFEDYDVLLTPTLISEPVKLGTLRPSALENQLMHWVEKLPIGKALIHNKYAVALVQETLNQIGFTVLANIGGLPSMSVPLHWTSNHLPLGSQFTAAMGQEFLLLQLAKQLEEAAPWQTKRPEFDCLN